MTTLNVDISTLERVYPQQYQREYDAYRERAYMDMPFFEDDIHQMAGEIDDDLRQFGMGIQIDWRHEGKRRLKVNWCIGSYNGTDGVAFEVDFYKRQPFEPEKFTFTELSPRLMRAYLAAMESLPMQACELAVSEGVLNLTIGESGYARGAPTMVVEWTMDGWWADEIRGTGTVFDGMSSEDFCDLIEEDAEAYVELMLYICQQYAEYMEEVALANYEFIGSEEAFKDWAEANEITFELEDAA